MDDAHLHPPEIRRILDELRLSHELLLSVLEQSFGRYNMPKEEYTFHSRGKPSVLNALYYLTTKGLIRPDQVLE